MRRELGAAAWARPSVLLRVAASTVAFWALVVFLVGHEVLYALSDGTDYPVVLLVVDGAEVLPISHGGLDSLGVGLIIVFLLLIREREERE